MSARVLILTGEDDEHATHVARMLQEAGAEAITFDLADLPGQAAVVYRGGGGARTRRLLCTSQGEVELAELTSIWYRRPGLMGSSGPTLSRYCRSETAETVTGLFESLERATKVRWLPGSPARQRTAECKIDQLVRAEALGLEIPPTLITNQPEEFLRFHREHGGKVISKIGSSASFALEYPHLVRYTEPVTRADLIHLDRLRNAPVIFQAYVPKEVELRVTVVASEVFAAEIHSQRSRHARFDWRRYDLAHTPHLPHTLPAEIQQACLDLVHGFGLSYGAIDFIVRPDGRYIFLELNPNGQYLWIEELTGLPISAAICRLLRGAGREAPPCPADDQARRAVA